jgi:hypothetical protein
VTAFDMRDVSALQSLWNKLGVPQPYEYLAVVTLEYAEQGRAMLASVQFTRLKDGYLPRKPRPVPLKRILTQGYLAELRESLDTCITKIHGAQYQLGQDELTLHVVVTPAFKNVGHALIKAFGDCYLLNRGAPDKELISVKFAYWGREAVDGRGKRVGSFYHLGHRQSYKEPWEPGAIAPPRDILTQHAIREYLEDLGPRYR